ncbi:hypothetical protein FGO68_gene12365 [Halteria grandinella]|uniref:Uncharacterized protein n=1 Tax=Halteria grandinella TaxID=5974 RepID=A0A8J8NTL9_HALGN|nr:hypothetical protein FGO68_gene12365 [Halteria grandinella]
MEINIIRLGRIPNQSLIIDILAFGHDELETFYLDLYLISYRFRQLLLSKYSLIKARLRDYVTGIELEKDPFISSKIEDMYSCAHQLFNLMNIPFRSQRRIKLHIISSNFSIEEWEILVQLLIEIIRTNRLRLHELNLTVNDTHIKQGCNSTLMSFAQYQIHQVTLTILSKNFPIPQTFTIPASTNLSLVIQSINVSSKFSPLKAKHISVEFSQRKEDLSAFLDYMHPTESFLIYQTRQFTAKNLIQELLIKSISFKKQWGKHIKKFIKLLPESKASEKLAYEASEQNIIVITDELDKEIKSQLWKWYKICPIKNLTSEDIQMRWDTGSQLLSTYFFIYQSINYNFSGSLKIARDSDLMALVNDIIHSRDDARDPEDQKRLNLLTNNISFQGQFCYPILAEAVIVRYPNLENLTLRFMEAQFSDEEAQYDFSMPDFENNKLKILKITIQAKYSIHMQPNVAMVIGNLIAKCRNLESVVICKENKGKQEAVDPKHELLPNILKGCERLKVQLPKLHLQCPGTQRSQHSPYILDFLFSPLLNVRHLVMSISNQQIGEFPELIQQEYQGRCINTNLELFEIELYGDGYSQAQQVSFLRALHGSMEKRRHLVVSWNWSMNQDMYEQVLDLEPQLRVICNVDMTILEADYLRKTVKKIKEKKK